MTAHNGSCGQALLRALDSEVIVIRRSGWSGEMAVADKAKREAQRRKGSSYFFFFFVTSISPDGVQAWRQGADLARLKDG